MGEETDGKEQRPSSSFGAGIAIGAGMGVALGVAMDNIGVGIALGVGIGVAIGAAMDQARRRAGSEPEQDDPMDAE
jgi:hypothetical protein